MIAKSIETRKRYDSTLATHDDGRLRRTILLRSEQRSGSTLLGDALSFAGGLGCPLDYVHAGFRLVASVPDETDPALYRHAATVLGAAMESATFLHLKRLDRMRGAAVPAPRLHRQCGRRPQDFALRDPRAAQARLTESKGQICP